MGSKTRGSSPLRNAILAILLGGVCWLDPSPVYQGTGRFCVSADQHLPAWEFNSKTKTFGYTHRPFFAPCEEVPHVGKA